jgi:sugar phosphate isomerase/epimerase
VKAAVIDTVMGGVGELERFERARRLGVAGIEVELQRAGLRGGDTDRLRRASEATGLEIASLILGEHNRVGGVGDADGDVAAAAAEDVRAAVGWAARLGAGVVLVPFFQRAEPDGEAGFERCVEAFRALCPAAQAAGVVLCFEGLLPAARILELAERVASPAFGCTFDSANPLSVGLDGPSEARALGGLIRRAHVKDLLVRRGDARPGLGRVDFPATARALAEIGYDGWLVLETPAGPPELVARDLSFARSVFPSLEPQQPWPRFAGFSTPFGSGEWERLAEAFAEVGLGAVQLHGALLDDCLDGLAPRLAGLEIVGLGAYRNLVAADEAVRRANVEYVGRCLELAPSLRTSVVATESGTRHPSAAWGDSPENLGEEAWGLLAKALELLLPVAERAGSLLALEGHVGHVLRKPEQLLGLLERFPSEHLQVVCDPYNYVSRRLLPAHERSTSEFLERFEHRFVLAHLKDVGPEGAEVSTPELGAGVFAQHPYLEFLRSRRPDLPLVLEHLPLDHVPAAIERVLALAVPSGAG